MATADRREPPQGRLDSWKEIAAHLNRGVTTVQRWERDEEELINQMAQRCSPGLAIIARPSAMVYKRTRKTVQQIASDLGLDYLIEGSVRRSGDQVRNRRAAHRCP
jgi:hypothetical protein